MGLVCASVYILLLILFIPFAFSNFFKQAEAEGLANVFPHFQVSEYYTKSYMPAQVVLVVGLSIICASYITGYISGIP